MINMHINQCYQTTIKVTNLKGNATEDEDNEILR